MFRDFPGTFPELFWNCFRHFLIFLEICKKLFDMLQNPPNLEFEIEYNENCQEKIVTFMREFYNIAGGYLDLNKLVDKDFVLKFNDT